MSRPTAESRFWAKVNKTDSCWVWTAVLFKDGYGQLRVGNTMVRAHRFAWEMVNGPVPAGMEVCHSCDVRSCVNPSHLFVGSKTDNMRDASAKGRIRAQKRTHCAKGHEYTPENTLTYRSGAAKDGKPYYQRKCRACRTGNSESSSVVSDRWAQTEGRTHP